MKHRIRAAVLITRGDEILLVEHIEEDGSRWWVPPGGGVEGDETFVQCARREAREETGLEVEVGRLLYVREFLEVPQDTRHAELFFEGLSVRGELHRGTRRDGLFSHLVTSARYVHRSELPAVTVWPEILLKEFWEDRDLGFPQTRYLGLSAWEGR